MLNQGAQKMVFGLISAINLPATKHMLNQGSCKMFFGLISAINLPATNTDGDRADSDPDHCMARKKKLRACSRCWFASFEVS